MGGRARKSAIARSKTPDHGQSIGARRVRRPDRLTRRPGTETRQVRTVRATTSCPAGVISPRIADHLMRSWASTAHRSHAQLALQCPDGCQRPLVSPHGRPSEFPGYGHEPPRVWPRNSPPSHRLIWSEASPPCRSLRLVDGSTLLRSGRRGRGVTAGRPVRLRGSAA